MTTTGILGPRPRRGPLGRSDIVRAVVRDGVVHRFDERTVTVLQRGDRVVVVRPARGTRG